MSVKDRYARLPIFLLVLAAAWFVSTLFQSPHQVLTPQKTAVLLDRFASAPESSPETSFRPGPVFEPNLGQFRGDFDFLCRGAGYNLFLRPARAVLVLQPEPNDGRSPAVIDMMLLDSDPAAVIEGGNRKQGCSNYFIGRDRDKWKTGVAQYGRVLSRGVYPGVDLVYYGRPDQLEHDFMVAPGVDPGVIRLGFEGAELEIDADGNLVLKNRIRDVVMHAPRMYQEIGGHRVEVVGSYVLKDENIAGFQVGPYDREYTLVIDPTLEYSTYIGGSSSEWGRPGLAVDPEGNAYLCGPTASADFPTLAAYDNALGGATDGVIVKVDPSGTSVIYSTFIGGSATDYASGVAADQNGNVYVTGSTQSTDFPVSAGVFQPALSASQDAFVLKLSPNGSSLVYSTYVGGNNWDEAFAVQVDRTGAAYAAGYTSSTDFPTATAVQATFGGGYDAFLFKINRTGTGLVYSTYLGGSTNEYCYGLAVDYFGQAVITGGTDSINFPVVAAYQGAKAGGQDAFVSKFNSAGSALVFSTYLGGSSDDNSRAVAFGPSGEVAVTGHTQSADFPKVNAVQGTMGGAKCVFLSKFNSAGSALAASTYLGGSGNLSEAGTGVEFGPEGALHVSGGTEFTPFTVTGDAVQGTKGGSGDGFISKLDPTVQNFIFSSFLGGSNNEFSVNVALTRDGDIWLAGHTYSADFPTIRAYQDNLAGGGDLTLTRLEMVDTVPNDSASLAIPAGDNRLGFRSGRCAPAAVGPGHPDRHRIADRHVHHHGHAPGPLERPDPGL